MRHALLALALTLAACTAEPEPIAPAVEPAPAAPAPAPAEPEPVSPVALTATLTVDGDTVTVTGTSNLPDGAVLVWELSTPVSVSEVLRDSEGQVWVPEGAATIASGAYAFAVTSDGWGELGLCDALPLELWVSYYPLAESAAIAAQPESLYALHGERGELIPGAVPPAELVELPVPEGSQRVELVVTCP
jgi:hypothetical protein